MKECVAQSDPAELRPPWAIGPRQDVYGLPCDVRRAGVEKSVAVAP